MANWRRAAANAPTTHDMLQHAGSPVFSAPATDDASRLEGWPEEEIDDTPTP